MQGPNVSSDKLLSDDAHFFSFFAYTSPPSLSSPTLKAHTGGLLGGMLMSGIIFGDSVKRPRTRAAVRGGSAVLLAAYLVVGFVVVAVVIEPDRDLLHICGYYRASLNDPSIPC